MDSHDPVLHDLAVRLTGEHDFTCVMRRIDPPIHHFDVVWGVVVVFDGDGHVVFVGKQFAIKARHISRFHFAKGAQCIGAVVEQPDERIQIWSHDVGELHGGIIGRKERGKSGASIVVGSLREPLYGLRTTGLY